MAGTYNIASAYLARLNWNFPSIGPTHSKRSSTVTISGRRWTTQRSVSLETVIATVFLTTITERRGRQFQNKGLHSLQRARRRKLNISVVVNLTRTLEIFPKYLRIQPPDDSTAAVRIRAVCEVTE